MAVTGVDSVLHAIGKQGGVYILGIMLPIWAVVVIKFCFAYGVEVLAGSPQSFRLAMKIVDPAKVSPLVFESVIICATVVIMYRLGASLPPGCIVPTMPGLTC